MGTNEKETKRLLRTIGRLTRMLDVTAKDRHEQTRKVEKLEARYKTLDGALDNACRKLDEMDAEVTVWKTKAVNLEQDYATLQELSDLYKAAAEGGKEVTKRIEAESQKEGA